MNDLEKFLLMLDSNGIAYTKESDEFTTDIGFERSSNEYGCIIIFNSSDGKLLGVEPYCNIYSE